MKIERFSWQEISKLIINISLEIKKDFNPEIIVAIQRGGFIPAVYLSHLLSVRDIRPLYIQRTEDDNIIAEKTGPIIKYTRLLAGIQSRNVLIVDDIVGSGETLRVAKETIASQMPQSIKSATILVNDENLDKTKDKPAIDYIGKRIRAWAIFPWENFD